MYKVWQYHLKVKGYQFKQIKLICHLAKNYYNHCLYLLREEYDKHHKITFSQKTLWLMARANPNFNLIERSTVSDIVTKTYTSFDNFCHGITRMPQFFGKQSYRSFVSTTVDYNQDRTRVRFPLPECMKDRTILEQSYSDPLIDLWLSYFKPSDFREWEIKIPKVLRQFAIHQLRFVFHSREEVWVQFLFDDGITLAKQKDGLYEHAAAIDIGMDNAAAVIFPDNTSRLYDGRCMKSMINLYNKKNAKLLSKLNPKERRTCHKFLANKRRLRNKQRDFVEKTSRRVVNDLMKHKVECVSIGKVMGMKKGGIHNDVMNKKRKKEVNGVYSPFPLFKLVCRIQQKAEEAGIKVHLVDESYTSKASFYDGDIPSEGQKFTGKRIRRGLYRTKKGQLVNADINAALNILVRTSFVSRNLISRLRSSGLTTPVRVIAAI